MAEQNGTQPGAANKESGGQQWRQWLRSRWTIGGALGLLAYALAGFFGAPWLVNRYLPRYLNEQLQHQASLGRVRINPFLFTCELREFQLRDAEGTPLLEFARLFIDFELESLFRRAWTFADIDLESPSLHLLIGEDGRLNLARLAEMLPAGEEPSATPPPADKPVRMLLKRANLTAGTVHFSDHSGSTPVAVSSTPISLELREISTLPERRGSHLLTAVLPGGGKLGWRGEATLIPLASHGTLELDDFQPAAVWQFFQDQFKLAKPEGVVRLHFDYRFAHAQGETTLVAQPLDLAVQGLVVREKGREQPLLHLAGLEATNARFDLARRELHFPSIVLRQGGLNAVMDRDGVLNWQQLLIPADQEATSAAAPVIPGAAAPAWRFALDRLELADFALDYADHGFSPALEYGLRDLTVSLTGIDTESKQPIQVAAKARVAQGGSVAASGSLAQDGTEAVGKIKVDRLNLRPLDPVLGEHLLLRLAAGEFFLDGGFSRQAGPAVPQFKAQGNLGINNLRLTERVTGQPFLACKELAVAGLDFTLAPDRLAIREVKLTEPAASVVIFKDRSFNLAKIIREKPARPLESSPFPLSVERVRLENGVVDFADFSLVLPFAARIEKFTGSARNITSDPAGRTTLQFNGQVGEFGQAKVDGALAPLTPKKFTDIQVTFRNVDLPPLSPYAATFAGRRIVAGRLDLDLGYKIKESELLGDNKIVLKKFTLGERVESPSALDLPLDLAIALLTDTQGKIDLALPVRGNVDDPEFSYGHVIWQVVRNLLHRIVTAPFRALAALFGGGEQQPDTVFFEPGRAELAPPEREKVRQVSAALGQRPQLRLIVPGAFAEDLDGAALRELAVRRALAQRLGMVLASEEDPGPVVFDHAQSQRALETLADSAALAEFQAAYEKEAGRPARRVNPDLALVGRGSDDFDFYQALFQHLVKTAPLAGDALPTLAAARQQAIILEFTTGAGLAPERLKVGEIVSTEGKDKSVPLKMELGAR